MTKRFDMETIRIIGIKIAGIDDMGTIPIISGTGYLPLVIFNPHIGHDIYGATGGGQALSVSNKYIGFGSNADVALYNKQFNINLLYIRYEWIYAASGQERRKSEN
jgi:hypothetical protein